MVLRLSISIYQSQAIIYLLFQAMFGSLFLHGNSETQIKYSHWRGNASDMGGGGGGGAVPPPQRATNIMNKAQSS